MSVEAGETASRPVQVQQLSTNETRNQKTIKTESNIFQMNQRMNCMDQKMFIWRRETSKDPTNVTVPNSGGSLRRTKSKESGKPRTIFPLSGQCNSFPGCHIYVTTLFHNTNCKIPAQKCQLLISEGGNCQNVSKSMRIKRLHSMHGSTGRGCSLEKIGYTRRVAVYVWIPVFWPPGMCDMKNSAPVTDNGLCRASQHSGLRGQLMSRMISNEKMHLLEATIQKRVTNKTIAVQTDNEFTELLNFLAIPRNDIDSPDLSTRLSCNRSPSNLTLRTLQSYHTAFERLPSMDNSYTRNHARAQMNDSGIYHVCLLPNDLLNVDDRNECLQVFLTDKNTVRVSISTNLFIKSTQWLFQPESKILIYSFLKPKTDLLVDRLKRQWDAADVDSRKAKISGTGDVLSQMRTQDSRKGLFAEKAEFHAERVEKGVVHIAW